MVSSTSRKSDQPPLPVVHHARTFAQRTRDFFAGYFWFILKNVIGWVLMISALPVGFVVPGPGGFPLFLLGFALVTFPGKRRLTARVMRGRGLELGAAFFTAITTFISLLLTGVIIWVLAKRYGWAIETYSIKPASVIGVCALAAAITWLVTRLALRMLNAILTNMPRVRRFIRPWLRQRGIKVLPPRRKRGAVVDETVVAGNEEILEIHPRHQRRLVTAWTASKPWLKRVASLTITILILLWIFKPIKEQWPAVREQILDTSPLRFIIATLMFAVFLFAFRAVSWWQILAGFGHRLPLRVATRIWSISELARYVPGAIWQVVGRVYLVKPYGVGGTVSSTSQILEVFTFLLANVLVATSCLLYYGVRRDVDGSARGWLVAAMALVPALAIVLHPRIFYRLVNRVLAMMFKPPITQRLPGKRQLLLLGWAIVGLLWQSLAVWFITAEALMLPIEKWWVVAGAYSLAWCAGFLAFWAPGGIGVREVVFMTAMLVIIPPRVKENFDDPAKMTAFLAYLSVLLRLWTIAGEFILSAVSIGLDFGGVMGRADAPGRVPVVNEKPPQVATPSAPPLAASQR